MVVNGVVVDGVIVAGVVVVGGFRALTTPAERGNLPSQAHLNPSEILLGPLVPKGDVSLVTFVCLDEIKGLEYQLQLANMTGHTQR